MFYIYTLFAIESTSSGHQNVLLKVNYNGQASTSKPLIEGD